MIGGAVATVTACTGLVVTTALQASADTVYEITGEWEADTPAVATSGDVVTGVWRVNVNDDAAAPSNEPVDNVTFSVTLENGVFGELPDACLTDGVDPASALSADGATLTCNLGTKDQGTAVVVQTPIEVDGPTGSQLTASGTIAGLTADLDPIDIENPFGMDIRWGTGTPYFTRGADNFEMDLQWTLSKARRSDPGPQTVTYDLTIASAQGSAVEIAPQQCTPFTAQAADGHPWSGGDHPPDRLTSFVDGCEIVQTGPNTFRLTLTGIDYEPTNPPTLDSAGNRLPTDEVALASGSIWIRVVTDAAGSVELTSSAPTYTSPTGATAQDDPANNTESKAWTTPGLYSSGWARGFTGSGGTTWDNTYQVSAGTEVAQYMHTLYQLRSDRADDLPVGMCSALDTRYVTFDRFVLNVPAAGVPGAVVEYYTGNDAHLDPASAGYDPYNFDCGVAGGWSTTPPADPSQVKAVRYTMTQGQAEVVAAENIVPHVVVTINPDTPPGTDVWSFMTVQYDTPEWSARDFCNTPIPGGRYPCTTGYADVLHVLAATPAISKSVDRSVVTPGVPATYTLTYSANGAGAIPATMDGFEIVDTLPVGITYVAGSASPEPTVTTNGSGQQVLTWTLDGVATNTDHALTYQAVADATTTPGQTLTNEAVASLGGTSTAPARAQVTVSTNGYTTIGKAADTPFIPNLAGDGVGAGSWTVTLRSFDPLPQSFTDTIDILPFNGDDRGTDFAGGYALTGVGAVAGATVYYTTADPASLSDDPGDASNGAAGDIAGNTVGWTTTFTPDATAVRVIGPELAPGATQAFTVEVETDGVEGGDMLVNRAQARDGHTELVMRTSALITVANYYSASLKKYVQDADGTWRDANTVEDYPTHKPGDTVPYRIVVENTGQGALTNLVITDDLFPEGSFTVDELSPGGQEVHEFEIVLEEGGPDTVVNTACGAADIPEDSDVPPTINCDPAGLEVDGDPAHTKELVSATPIGGGQWEVVYGIEVSNTSTASTSYTLEDTLHFTDEADIVSAELTASPDGVTPADPAWDGQGETLIASGVPLAGNDDDGYAVHRYELTVIADVPLNIPGAGSGDDPTQCGGADDDPDADTAFNNTSAMTDSAGEVEEDQACAPIPSIGIEKSVSEGPVPNGDGTWTVTYDIVASNSGTADGEYDVTDRMTADGDLEVVSGSVTTAPDGVTPSGSWTGLGAEGAPENVIASGVNLPAGESHSYQVEVVIGIAGDAGGAPVITPCSELGEDGPGGLSNAAGIEHNDLADDAEACVTIAYITVDKTVSSGPVPNGDGTWTVVYDIVADNTGEATGEYEVTDRLHFGEGITIVSAGVSTAPDGVTLEDGWTGLGGEGDAANVVASGVELAGGGTHTYRVEVVVELDEATIDPAALVCPPPGTGENGGLANSTTLDHNGIVAQDEVCPTLPLIDVDKTISDGPTPNGDGTWTITYDLVATNTGAAAGDYDLTDQLRYGEGVVVESADVVTTPDGVADPDGWTGQGADLAAAENVIVTGVTLDAGGEHTYRVQVVVSLDEAVATPDSLACPEPGSGDSGGLANSTGLTHNGEVQDDDACAALPLIDITKTLSGAVTPVDGQDGVYDVAYEIAVTNSGPGAGVYDLDDTLAPGEGVTVVGIQDVATDASDLVGINPDFDGVEEPRIVTNQPIAEAPDAAVVHTYTVTVRYSVDLSGIVFPDTADGCTTPGGGTADGALNNVADVTWNGIEDSDDECVRPGKPTLDKALVSADPVGDGKWKVVYDLTVGNVGTEPTTYDLDDEFLFAPVITTEDVAVTGPEDVPLNEGFDGDADQRIATDVAIAGLDDGGYAPHVYRVTVVANVPLHFDEVGVDGAGSPACTVPAGSNLVQQGLNNAATLTDETGGMQTDTDCAPVPSKEITPNEPGKPGDPGTPSNPPGNLASTGADIGWIAGGGVLLILLGALAIVLARRHRRDVG